MLFVFINKFNIKTDQQYHSELWYEINSFFWDETFVEFKKIISHLVMDFLVIYNFWTEIENVLVVNHLLYFSFCTGFYFVAFNDGVRSEATAASRKEEKTHR